MLLVSESEVRQVLDLDDLAEALSTALTALAAGATSVPARIAARTGAGMLAAMPGYVPGLGLAAKLVSVYPGNDGAVAPSHQAVVVAFDEATGTPTALVSGSYLTAMRTAMTSALAARVLAGPGALTLAVLGAGVQGAAHLIALSHLLPVGEAVIASRNPGRAAELAARHPGARAVASFEEAAREADVVCCCTDATSPVLEDGWIRAGAHVSSVGSGAELPDGLVRRGRVVVESRDATAPPPTGAVELQGIDPASLTLLGDVLAGRAPGRRSPDEVTVFKSTGHAVEDVAACAVALHRAQALGVGTVLPL